MATTNTQESTNRAYQYLSAALQRGEWAVGTRLPSLKVLARSAHVANTCMSAAVKRLDAEGKVTLTRRRGIFAGRPVFLNVQPSLRLWEQVREHLARDIREGRFEPARPLPAPAQLQALYGCCYPTLRKALYALQSSHVISRTRNQYFVTPTIPPLFRPRLALIVASTSTNGLFISDRNYELVRTLENQCRLRGIVLETVMCSGTVPELTFRDGHALTRLGMIDSLLGSIVLAEGITAINALLDQTFSVGKPVAILDESGKLQFLRCAKAHPFALFYAGFTTTLGEKAARFLRNLGHNRIAWFSPFHASLWSRNRLEGIQHLFGKNCVDFVNEEFESIWDFVSSAEHGLAYYISPTNEDQTMRAEFFERFRKKFPKYDKVTIDAEYMLINASHRMALSALMQPMFEQAVADSSITAWVGCNDFTALLALEFLRERRVRVPDDVSVMGFDNTSEAFTHNLSSLDLCVSSIAYRMLEYILNPRGEPLAARRLPIEVEGQVIERGTTTKAPK